MKKSMIAALLLLIVGAFFRFALIGYKTTAYILWAVAVLVVLFALLKKKQMKRTRTVLTVLVCLGVAALIALEIPIIANARTDEDPQADYLIVLGAGVNGSTPSLSLVNRLTAAKDYLERFPDTVAIVSGGQGGGENLSEAEAMRRWLTQNGIPDGRILMEDRATTTEENITFSLDLLRERGEEDASIAIVSSEYHLCRAKQIARAQGIPAPIGVAGKTGYPVLKLNYFLREAFALAYQIVFG